MRDAMKGLLVGLAVLVLVGALAERAGWIAVDLPRPHGPGPWILARASGFTAFAALTAEVVLGLLMSTGRGTTWRTWLPKATRVELHRWLSPLTLALVGGHVAVLLADDFVRFDALDVLVPFVAPTRPIALGLGVLALYAAVVVHVSFGLRKRLGARTWRRLHYLSFATFLLAGIHGVAAGSDAGRPWALAMFGVPLAVVAVLVVVRVATAVRDLRDCAARAQRG